MPGNCRQTAGKGSFGPFSLRLMSQLFSGLGEPPRLFKKEPRAVAWERARLNRRNLYRPAIMGQLYLKNPVRLVSMVSWSVSPKKNGTYCGASSGNCREKVFRSLFAPTDAETFAGLGKPPRLIKKALRAELSACRNQKPEGRAWERARFNRRNLCALATSCSTAVAGRHLPGRTGQHVIGCYRRSRVTTLPVPE
jgi:hypothetical protein